MAKNTEELRNVCVSDGTMRTEDLFPKMYWVLKEYAPEKAKEFAEFAEDDSWMGGEEDGLIMDELFNALNEIAPEGCIFGSQEGDGACFGFWEVEEESCERRGRMLREGRSCSRRRMMKEMSARNGHVYGHTYTISQGNNTYEAYLLDADNKGYRFVVGDNEIEHNRPLTVNGQRMKVFGQNRTTNAKYINEYRAATGDMTSTLHEIIKVTEV